MQNLTLIIELTLFAIACILLGYRIRRKDFGNKRMRLRNLSHDISIAARQEVVHLLKQRIELLEVKNSNLRQFAYIISHNLHSQVNKIIALCALIKEQHHSADERVESEKMLERAGLNLRSILADVDLIIDNDDLEKAKQVVSVRESIELVRAMVQMESRLREAHISSIVEIEQLEIVKPYFESILFNLVSNGIKYVGDNIRPAIKIAVQPFQDRCRLVVEDNGVGISPQDLKKLFRPYSRVDHSRGGRGLGLFITKLQIEAIGGRIEVESEPGEGSKFIVTLPQGNG